MCGAGRSPTQQYWQRAFPITLLPLRGIAIVPSLQTYPVEFRAAAFILRSRPPIVQRYQVERKCCVNIARSAEDTSGNISSITIKYDLRHDGQTRPLKAASFLEQENNWKDRLPTCDVPTACIQPHLSARRVRSTPPTSLVGQPVLSTQAILLGCIYGRLCCVHRWWGCAVYRNEQWSYNNITLRENCSVNLALSVVIRVRLSRP